jgi:hypothetical protein
VRALRFYLTVFLSAFLLFLVQPLMAKQILPWFGGGSIVWAACLLFFQVALVGGYAYAHVTRRLGVRRQIWLHLALLALALLTLPILASARLKPVDGSEPVGRVIVVLASTVGVPYLLLSATAPMLQDWFARVFPDRSPYRLYVLSNIGSLGALAVYPLWLERYWTMPTQAIVWSVAFGVFAAACAWCAMLVRAGATADLGTGATAVPAERIGADTWIFWLLLPAIGSGLLVATTSALTQDVAAVPLLWIVPLSVYLLTFILAFAGIYWRWVGAALLAILLAAVTYVLHMDADFTVVTQASYLVAAFGAAALVCHGELAQLRPSSSHLTKYYLLMSIGSSLGAAFVALGAPLLFNSYVDLPLLFLFAIGALLALICRSIARAYPGAVTATVAVASVAALVIAGIYVVPTPKPDGLIAQSRGFYGMLRVTEEGSATHHLRKLWHGRIIHGVQYLPPSPLASIATSYYAPNSGIELAIGQHPNRDSSQPIKIGCMGLGSGTVAALAKPLDELHFFEIDPLVVRFSTTYFTYVKNSKARVSIVQGDARLSLEREMVSEQNRHTYDVLAIDAFSGDAIPVHLITREAVALYQQALKPEGILAVHVSNRYLDLKPIVRADAALFGYQVVEVIQSSGGPYEAIGNTWMLLTNNNDFIKRAMVFAETDVADEGSVLWTDNFSSLLAVWK